jgi:hypothetical protein
MKIFKTANYKKAQQFENDDMVPKDSWGGLSGVDFQQVVNLVKNGTPIKNAIYQIKPDFNEEKFDAVSKVLSTMIRKGKL